MWLVVVDCIVYHSFDCVLSGLYVSCSRMFIELPVTESYIRLFKKCRNDKSQVEIEVSIVIAQLRHECSLAQLLLVQMFDVSKIQEQ